MNILVILIFQLATTSQGGDTNDSTYKLLFDKADNRIEVLVGDSVIYDSGIIGYKPNLNLEVGIDNALLNYSRELRVRLYNGADYLEEGEDIHWEIRYYLYRNKEIVDSYWREGDDGRNGVVFESKFTLR